MTTLAFFNNKGGVGKTTLVYHLAWMYAELGERVVVADLDPQANLSAMFLDEERLEQLWPDQGKRRSVYGAVQPILKGKGDIESPHLEEISERLSLVVGDLALSDFEDRLSDAWPRCTDGDEAAFRATTAFYRIVKTAAAETDASLVLLDVGPNLGAINRAALLASEFIVAPLSPDLFSLQGLRNLGPRLIQWRNQWKERLRQAPDENELDAPRHDPMMEPLGYVVMQHGIRASEPIKAYARWMQKIEQEYPMKVIEPKQSDDAPQGSYRIGDIKHYRSLMQLAMEARVPMFKLRPAQGAIGSHYRAVKNCHEDFRTLAQEILKRANVHSERA